MRGRRRGTPDQDRWERQDWWGVVVDSPDPKAAARFYATLLGWSLWRPDEMDDDEAGVDSGEGITGIMFHRKDDYVRPVWPSAAGAQQMMMHLDFEVSDLAEATAHAVELGAELVAHQPQDDVRVLLDPDGHPFCLYAHTPAAAPE